jgi:hypothetical protein
MNLHGTPDFILWQNAFLVSTDLCLIVLFGLYTFRRIQAKEWRMWRTDAGLALLVYFIGQLCVRGALLLWRHGLLGSPDDQFHSVVFYIGTVISTLGIICLIRVFSSVAWGPRAWIACMVAAAFGSWLMY